MYTVQAFVGLKNLGVLVLWVYEWGVHGRHGAVPDMAQNAPDSQRS